MDYKAPLVIKGQQENKAPQENKALQDIKLSLVFKV